MLFAIFLAFFASAQTFAQRQIELDNIKKNYDAATTALNNYMKSGGTTYTDLYKKLLNDQTNASQKYADKYNELLQAKAQAKAQAKETIQGYINKLPTESQLQKIEADIKALKPGKDSLAVIERSSSQIEAAIKTVNDNFKSVPKDLVTREYRTLIQRAKSNLSALQRVLQAKRRELTGSNTNKF